MKNPNFKDTFKEKYKKYLTRMLIVIIVFISVVFLLSDKYWSHTKNSQYNGSYHYSENSWVFKKGDEIINSELKVPSFMQMDKDVSYSISTKLTYDGTNDRTPTCFFFVDHMFCKVFLDGTEIFNYTKENIKKPDLSKSPGNVYVAAKLPSDCMGKELTIEFIPSLDAKIDYQLPNPSFGDYATHMERTFWSELPLNVISILCLFLGISCILYSAISTKDTSYREGLFIGIFAILFGIYNITESDFDFYMISNPYHTYVIDYVTFTLVPIFLFAFLRERMVSKQRKIASGLIIFDLVMFGAELILHFSGIMDMREFLPIIHIVYSINVIANIILLLTNKDATQKKRLIFQIIPVLAGMCIDFSVYYIHIDIGSSDSTFTSLGVIIFLILEIFYMWKYSVEVYTESTKSLQYQQMAYIDSMTGIGNRRAFEIEKEALENGDKTFSSLTVVSADLNNLKITNDKLGHASGDFIIRSTANVLSALASNQGNAYRIGGDEFIVFLYNVNEDKFAQDMNTLHSSIENINNESNAKIDIAIGVKRSESDVNSAIEEADRNMYLDKEKRKSNPN